MAGVVEAEEGVARTLGHQLRGERVEAAGVVQPAVQRQPLRAGGRTFATIRDIIISDSVTIREQLIWQIKEFLYRHSILSIIYHIRADAFRFFGL